MLPFRSKVKMGVKGQGQIFKSKVEVKGQCPGQICLSGLTFLGLNENEKKKKNNYVAFYIKSEGGGQRSRSNIGVKGQGQRSMSRSNVCQVTVN